MKKLFITLFAVLSLYSYSHAQTSGRTEFGIFAGLNSSYVVQGNQQASTLTGFNAGVSADHYFSDRWSLKVQIAYDEKGWSDGFLSFSTPSSSASYGGVNYHLNYITVPVMANWHFGRTRNWYLDFGPYVGFLVSAQTSGSYTGDVKPFFNGTDGGLAYNIGIKLPISESTKFFIELGGQAGVSNVFKNSDGTFQTAKGNLNIGLNF